MQPREGPSGGAIPFEMPRSAIGILRRCVEEGLTAAECQKQLAKQKIALDVTQIAGWLKRERKATREPVPSSEEEDTSAKSGGDEEESGTEEEEESASEEEEEESATEEEEEGSAEQEELEVDEDEESIEEGDGDEDDGARRKGRNDKRRVQVVAGRTGMRNTNRWNVYQQQRKGTQKFPGRNGGYMSLHHR